MGISSSIMQLFPGTSKETVIFTMIGIIVGCLLAAFLSFRFFKLSIVLMAMATGFAFGSDDLGMLVADRISGFNAPLVLGITCAVVFAILAPKFYKLCIYLIGGIIGGTLGYTLLIGLMSELGIRIGIVTVIGVLACAFIGAKLLYKFFKPYLIISSSFGGSMIAAIFTAMMLFGENDLAVGISLIVGVVISVIAMFTQFKMNAGRDLNL